MKRLNIVDSSHDSIRKTDEVLKRFSEHKIGIPEAKAFCLMLNTKTSATKVALLAEKLEISKERVPIKILKTKKKK